MAQEGSDRLDKGCLPHVRRGAGEGRGGLDGEVLSCAGCRSLLSLELQFLKSGRWEEANGVIGCWSGLHLVGGLT